MHVSICLSPGVTFNISLIVSTSLILYVMDLPWRSVYEERLIKIDGNFPDTGILKHIIIILNSASSKHNKKVKYKRCCFSVLRNMFRKPTSQYWGNDNILMKFELRLTLSSLTCAQSTVKYCIQYVKQFVQGSSTSMVYSSSAENNQFKLSQYTVVAFTLILWFLKCVHFFLL